MHHALRPYATAGIALIGASIIVVTPVAAPPPSVQVRPVQLVDAYSDLFANTVANVDNIVSGANSSDITAVFSALFTNPLGVISALTNLDPTVTAGTSVPLQIGVELTPALELGLAQLGAEGATAGAISDVVAQLQSDPSNALTILYEGAATILNAGLNGADNVSLLGGIIDIPLYNGILAPIQTAGVDINLSDLVNALGLGNILSGLNLNELLGQIGLGDLTLGGLVDDLNLGSQSLGTILNDGGITTLGGLSTLLGLGGLKEGLGEALSSAGLLSPALVPVEGALNDISLGALLTADTTSITSTFPGVSLDTLLGDLNLSTVPIDLGSLGDLSNLTLGDLLGDLGLGNLADVTVSPFGGLITELVDIVPQQILASLAG